MDTSGKSVRLAVITPTLDWSHRTKTSNENFDLKVARDYVEEHVADSLRLMDEAAAMGADLVLGPEYFRGSEMFMTTLENRRDLVETVDGPTVQRMRELSGKRSIYLAAAMDMRHSDGLAQTGVLTGPRGELAGVQVKNTSVPQDSPLCKGYELFDVGVGRTGIFTCSDLTTYPEDPIALAKAGMQIVLVPGCGFAGAHWRSFLVVRAIDLSCVMVYSDGARGAIVSNKGGVLAECHAPGGIAFADVVIAPREPSERLRAAL